MQDIADGSDLVHSHSIGFEVVTQIVKVMICDISFNKSI